MYVMYVMYVCSKRVKKLLKTVDASLRIADQHSQFFQGWNLETLRAKPMAFLQKTEKSPQKTQ